MLSLPPTTPCRYPKLDHLPRVKHRSDQPTKIATVNIGMTDESIPESRQERYWVFISMYEATIMERPDVWFDAMCPRYQEDVDKKYDHKSF